jgi:cystathionine beta-lyase
MGAPPYKFFKMFDKRIDRKNTNSFKWEKYPSEVLPMWVADMDFEIAKPIQEAIRKNLDHGIIGYSIPSKELNEVAVKRLSEFHNWHIKEEWIVWLPAMVPSFYISVLACTTEGQGVMASTPIYRPFLEAASSNNRHLQAIPLIWQNERWEMDFEKMKNELKDTKLFFLCNPHNPNGRVYSKEELTQLASFCIENDIYIVSDEIHCDLVLEDSKKHLSIASISPEIAERTITLLSPSKTFNTPGLGIAYAIIPNQDIRKKFEKLKNGILPMISNFAMQGAIAAYTSAEPWRKELIQYLKSNHDFLMTEINAIDGLSMKPLEATYLAWVDYRNTGIPNFTALLEKHGLGVMDADIFGGSGFFRLNFATQKSRVEEALTRIKNAMDTVK